MPSQEETRTTDSTKLFCVYAREDRYLRDKLYSHLLVLIRQGIITNWYDLEINTGERWPQETKAEFNSADIILLLVSAYFMASDYCYSDEMRQALERHERGEARVIPIILRPVQWEDGPFGRLQVLPKDGQPITTWGNEDEAFLNAVQGIRTAITPLSHFQPLQRVIYPSATAISGPVKVLNIYTHKDSLLCDNLENHLSGLRRQGFIIGWHSLDIARNMGEIDNTDQYIYEAQLILLLISSDFMASEYCYSEKMRFILERHYAGEAVVIPIILRSTMLQGSSFENLAALPTEGKAVTTWNNEDEAFLDITLGIRKAIAAPLPSQVTSRKKGQTIIDPARYRLERIASGPIKLFYAYAREDQDLLEHLRKHLYPLTKEKLAIEFYDRLISAGSDWSSEIEKELNSAEFILLLVTANFVSSDYCYSTEMKRALERHEAGECIVIPVILRPVDWFGTPIGKLQALPTSGKPVTTWPDMDDAFSDIARNIRQISRLLIERAENKKKVQWILEGKLHSEAHQYDKALEAYEKVLELDPGDDIVRETLGRIQIQLERYDEALTTYEDLLRRSPSASSYLFKGLVLQRVGKSMEALAAYQKAREHGYLG